MEILEDGDESEIGERGVSVIFTDRASNLFSIKVNLSGGQKARGRVFALCPSSR
jgi:hypothetical protein